MTSERSKRRDFLSLIFIAKSISKKLLIKKIIIIIIIVILLHEKFLQFDWLRAVVFQLNLKYLHVKITNLLRVVV